MRDIYLNILYMVHYDMETMDKMDNALTCPGHKDLETWKHGHVLASNE